MQKNKVNSESTEAPEALETEAAVLTEHAEDKDKPRAPPAAEEPPAAPVGGEVEENAAPPTGEEDAAESSGSPKEEKPAVSGQIDHDNS